MAIWNFSGGNHALAIGFWRLTVALGKMVPEFVFIKITAKDVT